MQGTRGRPSRARKTGVVSQSMPWLLKTGTKIAARRARGHAVSAAMTAPLTKDTRMSACASAKTIWEGKCREMCVSPLGIALKG